MHEHLTLECFTLVYYMLQMLSKVIQQGKMMRGKITNTTHAKYQSDSTTKEMVGGEYTGNENEVKNRMNY